MHRELLRALNIDEKGGSLGNLASLLLPRDLKRETEVLNFARSGSNSAAHNDER